MLDAIVLHTWLPTCNWYNAGWWKYLTLEKDRNKSFLKEMYMNNWMDALTDKGHKQGVHVQWTWLYNLHNHPHISNSDMNWQHVDCYNMYRDGCVQCSNVVQGHCTLAPSLYQPVYQSNHPYIFWVPKEILTLIAFIVYELKNNCYNFLVGRVVSVGTPM